LLQQKVDSFTLSVTNGEDSSTIQLRAGATVISSQTIRFTGDVVFESDLANGNTTISGDCITTGAISAEFLKLGGEMTLYESLDDDAGKLGTFGYVYGKLYGSTYEGCGIFATSDTLVLCGAEDDVLIVAANDVGIVSGDNINLDATGYVQILGEYLIPKVDCYSYCGSYSHQWYQGYFDTIYVGADPILLSDSRQKENVSYELSQYLAIFDQLKPCSYKFIKGERTHLGMIAQEVESAAENAGVTLDHFAAVCIDKENDVYGLRYGEFVPLLIAKVQQLDAELRALKKRIILEV